MKSIAEKYQKLLTKKEKADLKIEELRDECGHPNATHEYRGNTDNYDPTNDCYWIEYNCPDCGKRWVTEQ